jgi:hypothetical protein
MLQDYEREILAGRRLLILLVTALVLVGLFFLIRPPLPDGAAEARTIAVAVRSGTMTPSEVTVAEGDSVTLSITSDRAFDFHLHGYDLAHDDPRLRRDADRGFRHRR